jgi:hypothetical protein
MNALGNLIADLFSEFAGDSPLKKALVLIILIVFLTIVFFVSLFAKDIATDEIGTKPIKNRIELLQQLQEIELAGIDPSSELYPIYQELVLEVTNYQPAVSRLEPRFLANIGLQQFWAGSFGWLVVGVLLLFGKENRKVNFAIAIILGVAHGALFTFVPNEWGVGRSMATLIFSYFAFFAILIGISKFSNT